jgi:hypothetical protein
MATWCVQPDRIPSVAEYFVYEGGALVSTGIKKPEWQVEAPLASLKAAQM